MAELFFHFRVSDFVGDVLDVELLELVELFFHGIGEDGDFFDGFELLGVGFNGRLEVLLFGFVVGFGFGRFVPFGFGGNFLSHV